jgi:hypothetical protein
MSFSVHLGSADTTRIHLGPGPRRRTDPWPLPRALTELAAVGAVRTQAPRTLGSGRGMPLLSAQDLTWSGRTVHLDVRGDDDDRLGVEAFLELPAWDELVAAGVSEESVWELVDVAAAALGATAGVIADGEAPLPGEPCADVVAALRRHLGVLVPEGTPDPGPVACRYRTLPRCGLEVLLR